MYFLKPCIKCIKDSSFWPYLGRMVQMSVVVGKNVPGATLFTTSTLTLLSRFGIFSMKLCSVGRHPSAAPENLAPPRLRRLQGGL